MCPQKSTRVPFASIKCVCSCGLGHWYKLKFPVIQDGKSEKNTIMSKSIFKTLFGYWSINSHFNGHTDLEKLSSTLSDMNGLYR